MFNVSDHAIDRYILRFEKVKSRKEAYIEILELVKYADVIAVRRNKEKEVAYRHEDIVFICEERGKLNNITTVLYYKSDHHNWWKLKENKDEKNWNNTMHNYDNTTCF